MEYVSYVPCSKMKPCDLGSISKSLEAAMERLEALRRGYDNGVHTKKATSNHGVPREPKPPDLFHEEHHLLRQCSKSSPALRGRGKAFTLPSFSGENSRAFVSWLYEVECYFENKCFSDKEKCKLVVSCLKGFALMWYHTLNLSRTMEGKGRIRSWFKLETKMRLKFIPCSTMNEFWAELKTLKQNSLSVIEYAKLFEELHFVCDKEVDSVQKGVRFHYGLKSEISKRIKLELMNPYGKLLELALCVERSLARLRKQEVLAETKRLEATKTVGKERGLDQGILEPCLNIVHHESKCIEPRVMVTRDGMNSSCTTVFKSLCLDNEPTLNTTFETANQEKEQANTNLDLLHGASKGQVPDLDPLELIVNQGLPDLQNLWFGQSIRMFRSRGCWYSIKGEAMGESWVVPYSNVPNLTPCTRPDPYFKANILGGITCTLSTPHFHFYMLVRLKVSLDHLGAVPYMSKVENGDMSYNIYKLPWGDVVTCFEEFRHFQTPYHEVIKLLSRMSIFEIFILINSRWKLIFGSEMHQLKPCCPVLKLLSFEVNVVEINCKNLLGMFGMSSTSSLHGPKGVNPFLKIPQKGEANQNLGSVQILECQKSKEKPQNSFKPYLFLNFGGKKVFDPGGTLNPTTLEDVDCLYEHPINGGLQFQNGIESLGKLGKVLKLYYQRSHAWGCDQPLTRANQGNEVLKYEYGNGTTRQVPFTILIYDPGGSHVTWSLEVAFKLERV